MLYFQYRTKFFKVSLSIILILVIIFLIIQTLPTLKTILEIIKAILIPVIISGALYYVFRPIRNFLEKHKIPRLLSVTFIFLLIISLAAVFMFFIWPTVSKEITEFTSQPKATIEKIENKIVDIFNLLNFSNTTKEQIKDFLDVYSHKLFSFLIENFFSTVGSLAQIAAYFIITPFMFFYLLKDDDKLSLGTQYFMPEKYSNLSKKILTTVDETLSRYISGQVLVALCIGILIFAGYEVIGLDYAPILALIAFFFNLIPFAGPFISTIPALLIGVSQYPFMAVKVLVVVLAVHMLDLNLISPKIVGYRLNIHPITIIILLIGGFFAFGILGMLIITPLYAVARTCIREILEIPMHPTIHSHKKQE